MKLPQPMIPGRLVRRYKRFLADVILDDGGERVTASTPNTGSMMGLLDEGNRVWLSVSDDPKRKYRHRWELVEVNGPAGPALVGLNTGQEVRYGEENSRIDLLLEDPERPPVYIEVKNVTLSREPGIAEFPDAVTARGAKHLRELARIAASGRARAAMVYLAQRPDAERFRLAEDIDPAYMDEWKRAVDAGVEVHALACDVTPQEISARKVIPVEIP